MKLNAKIVLSFIFIIILSISFVVNLYADAAPPWKYCSINDFEKWIYNNSDENKEFSSFSKDEIELYKNNYLPAGFVFGFDPNSFSKAILRYYVGLSGGVSQFNQFNFFLQYSNLEDKKQQNSRIEISIIKTPKNDVSGEIIQYNGNISELKTPKGNYKRSFGNKEVFYIINHDYQKQIRFWIDGYLFIITPIWGSENNIFDDVFKHFMTSEETKNLAALFSDDQAVFENAMANIELNIKNAQNYVYGQQRETIAPLETPKDSINVLWIILPTIGGFAVGCVVSILCIKNKRTNIPK